VLYDLATGVALWWTGTVGEVPGQAVLQGDGNFVGCTTRTARPSRRLPRMDMTTRDCLYRMTPTSWCMRQARSPYGGALGRCKTSLLSRGKYLTPSRELRLLVPSFRSMAATKRQPTRSDE
jgi:hypothetical protein